MPVHVELVFSWLAFGLRGWSGAAVQLFSRLADAAGPAVSPNGCVLSGEAEDRGIDVDGKAPDLNASSEGRRGRTGSLTYSQVVCSSRVESWCRLRDARTKLLRSRPMKLLFTRAGAGLIIGLVLGDGLAPIRDFVVERDWKDRLGSGDPCNVRKSQPWLVDNWR